MDLSISMNGIFAAQRMLEQSARRVTTPQPTTDYADEMIAIKRAKLTEEANYQVLSVERDLEGSLLDLFA